MAWWRYETAALPTELRQPVLSYSERQMPAPRHKVPRSPIEAPNLVCLFYPIRLMRAREKPDIYRAVIVAVFPVGGLFTFFTVILTTSKAYRRAGSLTMNTA